MLRSLIKREPFWPLAALGVIAIALWVGELLQFSHRFDETAKAREVEVVGNGLNAHMEEVAHLVVPEAVWDEAVRNLDNRYEAQWADKNIGQYFNQSDGFQLAYVLDGANRPLYAMRDGVNAPPASYSAYEAAAAPLVAAVRRAELTRPGGLTKLNDIQQATAAKAADGRLFVFTATLVQPDFGTARLQHGRAPVIVTGMEIDAHFIAQMANRYMLSNARLDTANNVRPDEARANFLDEHEHAIAAIAWRPQTPGQALLAKTLPVSLLAIALFGLFAVVFYRKGQRARQALVASEARAFHTASHDALTGLANRTLLMERLSFVLADLPQGGGACALLCIDLDRFKDVNDRFGHHVGDELIRQVKERLATIASIDDTLARIGGDDFALLHTDASHESASARAQTILTLLSQPFELSVSNVFVGASIGVLVVDEGGLEAGECMRRAEIALYEAKSKGRGRAEVFSIDMDTALSMRRELEHDLRLALNTGALSMVYQPQVDKTGRTLGVESLVRWTHPVHGPISPALFVPLAEETGMIEELGAFTIRQALIDSRIWPQIKVAINVSAVQLRRPGFALWIEAQTRELGVEPRRIELEITEGVLIGDDDDTRRTLTRLHDAGFAIALDDFGVGYSNFGYLQRYPIDKIKIDRSFVTNLSGDAEAGAVVSAIVKLGRALRLNVMAEGVETISQREQLAAIGCSQVQGFLTGRPMTPDALLAFLATGGSDAEAA